MAKRPLLLIVCSLLFLYFPFEVGWSLAKGEMVPTARIVMDLVMPALCLGGLLLVSRLGWYTLVAFVSLWGIRDLQLYYQQNGGTSTALVLHVIIYAVSLAYFINPRVRKLYFDPKLRWWRSKPRFETHMPLILRTDRWHYHILRNISDGGCFIETESLLPLNDRFQIALPLPVPLSLSVIQTIGEVRWVSNHPDKTGMGVQFIGTDHANARAIKEFVKEQL